MLFRALRSCRSISLCRASTGGAAASGSWPDASAAAVSAFELPHPQVVAHPHFRLALGHGVLEAALAPRLKEMLVASQDGGSGGGARTGAAILVVSGVSERAQRRAAYVLHLLRRAGLHAVSYGCPAPTASNVAAGVESAKRLGAAAVVSVGGGGTMDAGKAIAALLTNGGSALDYAVWGAADDGDSDSSAPDAGWEPEAGAAGRGKALGLPSVPHVAVPTLLGSGAEANPGAVLVDDSDRSLAPFVLLPHHLSAALVLLDFYAGDATGRGGDCAAAKAAPARYGSLPGQLQGARQMTAGFGATTPAALLCALGRALAELLQLASCGSGPGGVGAGEKEQENALRQRLALAAVVSLARRLAPVLGDGAGQATLAGAAGGKAGARHVGKRADAGLWAVDEDAAIASVCVGLLTSLSGFSAAQALALSTAAGGGDGNYADAGAALLPAALAHHTEALLEGELGGGGGGGGGGGYGSSTTSITAEYEAAAVEEQAMGMLRHAAATLGLVGAAEAEVPDELLGEALGTLLEELGVSAFGDGVGEGGEGLSKMAAQQLVSEAVGSFGGAATSSMGHNLLLTPKRMLNIVEES